MNKYSPIAAEIYEEQRLAKTWKWRAAYKKKYMYDEYGTKAFFVRVCNKMAGIGSNKANQMIEKIKSIDNSVARKKNRVWQFSYDAMYSALLENDKCKSVCEKNEYKNWYDIINRYDL